VAFQGTYHPNGTGIFIGDGSELTAIIKTGDALFGSTLTHLDFHRMGLDPNGRNLAFKYGLADGRAGIAMARFIPEPAESLLLVFACAFLVRAKASLRRVDLA
jgi:hypothetical protein